MTTIARNYRKHPHTATFLQTFHSGVGSVAARDNAKRVLAEALAAGVDGRDDNRAEIDLAARQAGEEDLLNLVPLTDYRPTQAQVAYMYDMIREIEAADAVLGQQAKDYTVKMIGHWTPENLRRWIGNLAAKRAELRKAPKFAPPAPAVQVADGRYAVEEDGALKFFKVKNGNRAGFVFLDVQASDDWHSVRNLTRIRSIIASIAQDPKAAMIRYGVELGECGRCGRTLTSEYRKLGIGPVCIDK